MASELAVLPRSNAVNLRLQAAKPVFGRHSIDPDKIAVALNNGKKEEVLPVLRHLTSAGKATIESLQAVECIGRVLRHRDPDVAAAAADALAVAEATGQRFEEALLQLLQREEVCVLAALAALGKMGPTIQPTRKALVVRQVAQCLSGNVPVRTRALRALAELKATRQALKIHDLLQAEKVPEVMGAAVEVLAQLSAMTLEAESCFPEEFREQKLGEMLGEPRLTYSALKAIAFLGPKAPASLLPRVTAKLAEADLSTRYAAAVALGAMAELVAASKETIDQLMAMLKSSDVSARAAACCAVAEMGSEAKLSRELVATLASDMEEAPKPQIASAGKRVPPQMVMPRCAAITALGAMGDREGAKVVAQGLLDKNWQVRLAAAEAMARLGEAANGYASGLIGLLRDEFHIVRAAACRAIGALRMPEALPGLAQAFEDPSAPVRCSALTAATELVRGAEEYCHEVFKAVTDREPEVRAAAVRCLARHEVLGENYVGVVAQQLLDGSPEVRAAAVAGLGQMGAAGRGFQDEVSFMMNDPSDMVRQAAAGALEQLGLRDSLAPIKPLAPRNTVGLRAALAPPDNKDPVEGLGQYYKNIMMKKSELIKCGKWIDDEIF
ncbi:Hypothetical protein SCF082_LOCUS10300 [Durusdinium trenchii]|uniref:TOG domain-containing protein n=1 Tax=Durusdinium trenchii TaxID=1381693 RepID=A0ABP0J590_9DINO